MSKLLCLYMFGWVVLMFMEGKFVFAQAILNVRVDQGKFWKKTQNQISG